MGRSGPSNLLLNTGHGTLGWTMAAGWGRVLADMISGRATAIDTAEARSHEVRFFRADILTQPPDERWDIVTSSLFLHHLDTPEAEVLLRRMTELSTGLILVNDLRRSKMGYLLAWVVCRLVSRSPVVHYDGPVSVRGAWSGDEAFLLGRRLKLKGLRVERRWPCRFLLSASGS